MKKLFIGLFATCGMFCTTFVNAETLPEVTDHEKVKLNIFWRQGCGACEAALNSLNDNEEKYLDYFEIVTYDINEGNNMELLTYLENELGGENSVPYFVVGDEHMVGFNEESLYALALKEYENPEYEDFVSKYAESKGGFSKETLEDACNKKNIQYWNPTKSEHKYDAYILGGIFAVLFAGFMYLIISPKKNH